MNQPKTEYTEGIESRIARLMRLLAEHEGTPTAGYSDRDLLGLLRWHYSTGVRGTDLIDAGMRSLRAGDRTNAVPLEAWITSQPVNVLQTEGEER